MGIKVFGFCAGIGAMSIALAELGADVYIVEPFGHEFLHKQGFAILRSLDEIPKGLTFDDIVTVDVVEHLSVPWNEIKSFKGLLKEFGWLYITKLNANGLSAKYDAHGGEKW